MGCSPGPPRSGRRATSLRTASRRPLELAAPHIVEIGAIRSRGGGFVEVYRDAEALPYLKTRLPCEHDALLQLDAGDGHKRHNVGCADAWMQTLMARKVDQFRSFSPLRAPLTQARPPADRRS